MLALLAALALGATACGMLPPFGPGGPGGPGGDPGIRPIGPRFELGPVPRFDAQGQDATDPASRVTWFQIQGGFCTERGDGSSCGMGAPGDGLPKPGDGLGFGGSEGRGETCIETVTHKEIVRIEVTLPDGEVVPLRPLDGSGPAPVNVYGACWERDLRFEDIRAEGFSADGERVASL